jgi:hypothetical protein
MTVVCVVVSKFGKDDEILRETGASTKTRTPRKGIIQLDG